MRCPEAIGVAPTHDALAAVPLLDTVEECLAALNSEIVNGPRIEVLELIDKRARALQRRKETVVTRGEVGR